MTQVLRLLVGMLLALVAVPAWAADRVALVIGNGDYVAAPYLKNPSNDAKLIGDALEQAGFEVTRALDLGLADLIMTLGAFSRTAARADTALIYYAGHGIEIDRQNYLIPVDARLELASDADFQALRLDLMIRSVEGAKTLGLVVIDACRNNPFAIRLDQARRGVNSGLGRIEPRGNTLVAYAAREGTLALDGVGDNSPYAQALGEALVTPGLEIGKLFRHVRDEVLAATGGAQEPVVFGTMSARDYYFIPPDGPQVAEPEIRPAEPPAASAVTLQIELAFWQAAEAGGTITEYELYLARYPEGTFAPLARQRIATIRARAADRVAALDQPPPPPPVFRDQNGKGAERVESTSPEPPPAVPEVEAADPPKTEAAAPEVGRTALEEAGSRIPGPADPRDEESDSGGGVDIAALPPDPLPPQPVTPAMIRQIQQELNRVGCSVGVADGVWGAASARGLQRFRELSPALRNVRSDGPNAAVLSALQGVAGRVCPEACAPGQTSFNGQCVTGATPPDVAATPNRRAPPPAERPPAGGACVVFNGRTVC